MDCQSKGKTWAGKKQNRRQEKRGKNDGWLSFHSTGSQSRHVRENQGSIQICYIQSSSGFKARTQFYIILRYTQEHILYVHRQDSF